MGTLALCYRIHGQEEPAFRLEDEIVDNRIRESTDVSRGILYRYIKAAITMEVLVKEYKRREWYTEIIRLFEIVIAAFRKHTGILAEETMFYVRFVIELNGRLGLDVKIDQILETMLPFVPQGHEQQQLLHDQILSLVKWSSNAKQNAAAHRVLLWQTIDGNLTPSVRIACIRNLETFAERLGEDLVREYSEQRILHERQMAELEQSIAD